MLELKKILVPTDFSPCADKALKYGTELARQFDAELHILHVLELHPSPTPAFGGGLALRSLHRESKVSAEANLAKLVKAIVPADVTMISETAEGNPNNEIVRYATDNEVELIVIGTHGRTGLARTIFGSVAENVVRQSECLVLSVHPNVNVGLQPAET